LESKITRLRNHRYCHPPSPLIGAYLQLRITGMRRNIRTIMAPGYIFTAREETEHAQKPSPRTQDTASLLLMTHHMLNRAQAQVSLPFSARLPRHHQPQSILSRHLHQPNLPQVQHYTLRSQHKKTRPSRQLPQQKLNIFSPPQHPPAFSPSPTRQKPDARNIPTCPCHSDQA
jgi:hypothetical protein